MAISFGGISSRGAGSFTVPPGTAPLLTMLSFFNNSSFTFGSQSMTKLGQETGPGFNIAQLWYLPNPVTGTSENFTGSVQWASYYYEASSLFAFQGVSGVGDGNPVFLTLNNNFGGFVESQVWGMLGGYDDSGGTVTVTASGFAQRATFSGNSQFVYDSNGPLPSGINTLTFSTISGHDYVYVACFILPYQPPAITTPGSFLQLMV